MLQRIEAVCAAHARGQDIGAEPVLARYARRRRSGDARDAYAFDAIERLFKQRAPAVVAARTLGIRVIQRTPALKRLLAGHAAGWPV